MVRSGARASLAVILALVATPLVAQQPRHDERPPGAAAGPANPAPQPGAAPGAMPATITAPRTVINNTFNPTGPTGTGTFNPTAEFIVCVSEGGSGRGGRLANMMAATAPHVEGRIAFLKAELKITDAQQPLWTAVAAAMREHTKSVATSGETTGPLPARLAALEKATAARLDVVRKLQAAVAPLYAALTDEQKRLADALTPDLGDGAICEAAQGRGSTGGDAPR